MVDGADQIEVVPATPERWPQFEDLFGKQGACYGCWCTYFRLPPSVRRQNDKDRNKAIIRARIEAGPPPGVLAVAGQLAVGWMQIGPRADVPEWNNKARASAPLDPHDAADPSVWAISCFFIRTRWRARGLTHRLVDGGIEFARAGGARRIEVCPINQSGDSRSIGLFVGSTRVFAKAGFAEVAHRKAGRPLMRLSLE